MGCCFSSNATATSNTTDQKNQNPLKPHHSPPKPPSLQSHETPPPPTEEEEEETVIKEVLVLSETPTFYKKQQEKNTQTPLTIPPKTQTEVSSPIKKQQQEQHQQQEQETSDLSQLSEIYSITETISTTTTTTTTATATKGLIDDEATSKENSEVKQKPAAKVIKKRPSNGDPGTGSGSVRASRVDPSPEKRARGRGRGSGEVRTVQRNVGSRSRSPATGRTGGVGRGAVGKSPTTVTEKPDGKPVGTVTADGQGKREEDGNGDASEQQLGTTESLENPLVSLECFIFL